MRAGYPGPTHLPRLPFRLAHVGVVLEGVAGLNNKGIDAISDQGIGQPVASLLEVCYCDGGCRVEEIQLCPEQIVD